jgi:hypothetical protein
LQRPDRRLLINRPARRTPPPPQGQKQVLAWEDFSFAFDGVFTYARTNYMVCLEIRKRPEHP